MSAPKRQKLDTYTSTAPLSASDFLHHPLLVLLGVVEGGLAGVSFKAETAVDYVLSTESILKLFGLLKENRNIIDNNMDSEDWKLGDVNIYEAQSLLEQEIQELERQQQQEQSNDKFDILEEIKNLSKEFTEPDEVNEGDEISEGLVPQDDFHNDKIRANFEKHYGEKVLFINGVKGTGISKDVPLVTFEGAQKEKLGDHLRVLRLGKVKV